MTSTHDRRPRLVALLLVAILVTGFAATVSVSAAAALPSCRVADVLTKHRLSGDWASRSWTGRIRTFDLLIQSQAPYRLATRQWSGRDDTASALLNPLAGARDRLRPVRSGEWTGVVRAGIVGS